MLLAHHGGQEPNVVARRGIEAPIGTTVVTDGLGEAAL
jgi:hypothetical protein